MVVLNVRLVGQEEDCVCKISFYNKEKIEKVTNIPVTYQSLKLRGKFLPGCDNPLESAKDGEEIIVTHMHLNKWTLYHECVETVLKNMNIPNRQDLLHTANTLKQDLTDSGFFDVYTEFGSYTLRNHWKVVKYLDEETVTIAAASREYFVILHGGSAGNFSFTYEPTQCGIILTVQLGDKMQNSKWQVKSHCHGGSTFRPYITRQDILELWCYKLLELIGVGPEVHFIFPSKAFRSKTAVYIGTLWRDDFVPLSNNESSEDTLNKEALVQLHLLQILLHVEDLHGLNCGTWKESKTAAIVDFCIGTGRKIPNSNFYRQHNSRLAWDDCEKEMLGRISGPDRLKIAKLWLKKWSFLQKVDEAYLFIKDILKRECSTGFSEHDTDQNAQATPDLKAYIGRLKAVVE